MSDPLALSGLSVSAVASLPDDKQKMPNPLDVMKEQRLAEKEKRMQQKQTPATKPAAAKQVVFEEPVVDKTKLLDKITAYRERFPNLKKRAGAVSAKSTAEELVDELHYIELQLGSGSGGTFGATILYGAMTGLETATRDYWNPLGLDLTGLGTVTQKNMKEFQPIIDELTIKHHAGMYTSPEWRLALALGASVITVHAANSNPEVARAVKGMNMHVNPPAGSADL